MMADILDKDLVGIVGSIFATSPEAMKIARERADLTRAQAVAQAEAQQMGGGTALSANIMGGQAVRQLGGLLGAEDPTMQRESAKRQLAVGLDMSKPEQVLEYAQRLTNAGLQQEAGQAIVAARAMQQQMANIVKTGREKDPEIIRLQTSRDALEERFGPNDRRVVELNKIIEGKGKVGQTNINIDQKGETEFVKQLAKNDADTVKDAIKTRTDAINSLNNLNTLATLNENELISGTYASGRVGAANFLQTIGLANEKDKNRLATSEQFQKVGRDLILQTLGGKLGAGFSNEDRKFIESLIPSLENSPIARKKLIEFMQTKFTNVVDEVGRLESYARDKNGLKGYTYKTPLPTSSVAPSGEGKPSKADIEAEAKRRGITL